MTDNILKKLVSEAVSLDREINEKSDRLKELNAELVAKALSCEKQLTPTVGGGTRWIAGGSDGCVVRVNFPAPTLRTRIDEGEASDKIKQLAGQAFNRLFVSNISYRSIEKFREEAVVLLRKADANGLIKLCQSVSAPRVSFETAHREVA